MKEYFVFADVHSFYTILINELTKKGFDINNPDHIIISCGDFFDRGDETKELLDFLYNLYKQNRAILIRGNHDDLFEQMINRGYPGNHDISNKTVKTLAHLQPNDMDEYFCVFSFNECCKNYDKRYKELLDNMVNYAETKNHIFVHGWIPNNLCDPDWRNASDDVWAEARWKNGMQEWKNGILEKDKTIVCGHWHCSYGWSHIDRKYKEFPAQTHEDFNFSFEPWKKDGIIAIDACTAYSKKINVLHLTEEEI